MRQSTLVNYCGMPSVRASHLFRVPIFTLIQNKGSLSSGSPLAGLLKAKCSVELSGSNKLFSYRERIEKKEIFMTYKGWLLFIAISVFWGIPYFFIKIAVQELDPTVVVFARVAVASLVLLPVAACRKELPQLRKHWLAISLLSIVQIIGPFLLISYGEQHITSSLASLLIAAEP